MARTSASRGKKGFSQKSGKNPVFKMMGSSPARVDPTEIVTMGEEQVVGTRTTETDKSTDVTTDYETRGKGYTPPPTDPEGDRAYAELTQAEKDAQDAKWKKMATRDIVQQRSETATTPKEKKTPYVPNPDLTAKRYSLSRVNISHGTYPKGDDGKPLVQLEDNAGNVIFKGSQTDYQAKYGDDLTRGGSQTQVGNKKQFLYTRGVQDESKAKYGDFFKSSATPKKSRGFKMKKKR